MDSEWVRTLGCGGIHSIKQSAGNLESSIGVGRANIDIVHGFK